MKTLRAMKSFSVTGTGTVLTAGSCGTYYIPKVMVRKITRQKGAYLSAIIEDRTISVFAADRGCVFKDAELVYIDMKGNLRIPDCLIKKARISRTSCNPYVVAVQDKNGNIVIS